MKALEKDAARRYQTADDFAQDLTNYLKGDTVRARPPSTWYQIQKFARRNRGLVAAMLVIGFALLAGVAGTTYGLLIANEKTELAEAEKGKAQQNEERAIEAESLAAVEALHARDSEAAAKFQLAIARWDAERAGDARDLLHQIPIEYRDNFEWHYCSRRFQGSGITCYGHTRDAYKVAFTPDGARVVSAGGDGTIRQWDATTGQEIGKLDAHEGRVLAIAVNADATRFASAGEDKTIKLWDIESGQVFHSLRGHESSIRDIAFNSTGDRIVSGSDDKSVKLWNAETGDFIATLNRHTAGVTGVAISPDGKTIASVGGDTQICIWDARDGKLITQFSGHNMQLNDVAFSPDGTRLIASSYGWSSHWDTDSWIQIAASRAHERHVQCIAFSPDGTQFATAGDDAKINVWNTRSNSIVKTFIGHANTVMSVAFSPDGTRLVSGSADRTVKLWDLNNGNKLAIKVPAKGQTVTFSNDGRLIASGSNIGNGRPTADDGTVTLWDARSGELLFTMKKHEYIVHNLSFSPDAKRLASAGHDKTVRIWNTETGEEVAVITGHDGAVLGVAYSPDGSMIATASSDRTAKLWDASSLKEIATLSGHRSGVYKVAFSPDGSRMATASSDKTAKLWDIQTAKELRTLKGHTGRLNWVEFDPRGERLVSAAYDSKVRMWDVASGKQIATAHIPSRIAWGVDFTPDGKRIVATGPQSTIDIYDAQSGQEVISIDRGGIHPGIPEVEFSHDGTRLVITGHDGYVSVYDAPRQHETTLLHGHTDTVASVTFSDDGLRIYSESANEKLVWNVAQRVIIKDATWDPPQTSAKTSSDERWYVTTELRNVVLVDLEYKNTPTEKAYRINKASIDPHWHEEQARAATEEQDWYAATFHYAVLVKNNPDQGLYFDDLEFSFQKLQSQFEQRDRKIELHLASVVHNSLQVPPIEEEPNSSFEEPEIRPDYCQFLETLPGWRTTGRWFEIWPTNFQGVEAHEGHQFVELNAREEATLYRDLVSIEKDAVIEFSFAHRGRNGDDIMKLTITDLGADNIAGTRDDKELFSKEYTTGKSAWAVYDSTTEPEIKAVGNRVRFAYSAVAATGGDGPDKTEGNFLDAAHFGVNGEVASRHAYGIKKLQVFSDNGKHPENRYLGMRENNVGIAGETESSGESI